MQTPMVATTTVVQGDRMGTDLFAIFEYIMWVAS